MVEMLLCVRSRRGHIRWWRPCCLEVFFSHLQANIERFLSIIGVPSAWCHCRIASRIIQKIATTAVEHMSLLIILYLRTQGDNLISRVLQQISVLGQFCPECGVGGGELFDERDELILSSQGWIGNDRRRR